jgi:tryptophanyl-tRNA synthetase
LGWGQAKKLFFEALNERLRGPRETYNHLLADPSHIESVLARGRDKARSMAAPFLDRIRDAVGVR